MEDKHPILYNYYSKYNGGNSALRLSKSLTKLAPMAKTLLKQVIEDLPGKMKESARDQIASDIFQGKNPLESFSQGLMNRAYNDIKSTGDYDRNELDTAFNKKNVIIDSRRNTPITYSYFRPNDNFNQYSNNDYDNNYDNNYHENNKEKKQQLYGGSIYMHKVDKYHNKLKIDNFIYN